jgi:hypothetical protein
MTGKVKEKLAEIKALDKLIEMIQDDEKSHAIYGETVSEKVERYINKCRRSRQEVYDMVGSLIEQQVHTLRALQLLVASALRGGTHKIKNARLWGMKDIIEAQIHQLLRDKERGPEYFTTVYYHDGSWDFRRVVGENMVLRKELEELRAKYEGDEQVEKKDSIKDEPPF